MCVCVCVRVCYWPTAADVNKAPVADAGRDVSIRLPNHMAMLDGSQSRDEDDEIVSWQWTRLEASPAVGVSAFVCLCEVFYSCDWNKARHAKHYGKYGFGGF